MDTPAAILAMRVLFHGQGAGVVDCVSVHLTRVMMIRGMHMHPTGPHEQQESREDRDQNTRAR